MVGDWVSTVDLWPGTDGYEGGAWRLVVTRAWDRPHWAAFARDTVESRGGMKVTRAPDGLLLRVEVADLRPFLEAAEDYGLDRDVFGSQTLWPVLHQQAEGVESGWFWYHISRPEPFPFAVPRQAHG